MTETKTFEPITTQEEFDERIKARLAREREKWEKGSDAEELRADLSARNEEIATIKREHYHEDVERAMRAELADRGVTDEGRIGRILRHVDLDTVEPGEDGRPSRAGVRDQLADVGKDLPELLTYRVGAGSGGSSRPVVTTEKPITRDELEGMSPDEVNSRWGQVKSFLAGERN